MLVTLIHFLSSSKEVRHPPHSPAPGGLELLAGLARAAHIVAGLVLTASGYAVGTAAGRFNRIEAPR